MIYDADNPPPPTLTLLREKRDFLLSRCDWTQMPDSPLSDTKKAEWAAYRQKLRDLPLDYSDSDDYGDVIWPIKPS